MNLSPSNKSYHLALHEILSDSSLAGTSEIKFGAKQGVYTDSDKPAGTLSSIFSFVARFLPGGNAKTFRKTHDFLANNISLQFGPEAGKAFRTEFSSRHYWAQPITADRIRKFSIGLLDNKSVLLDPKALSIILACKYGPENASHFKENFLRDATRMGTPTEIQDTFKTLPPQAKSQTIVAGEIKNIGELGYYISENDDHHGDALIPTGGFVRIYGDADREKLLEEMLYSPITNQNGIASSLDTATNELAEAQRHVTSFHVEGAPINLEDQKAADQRVQEAEASLLKLQKITQGYEKWPLPKLAAFHPFYQLLKDTEANFKAAKTNFHSFPKDDPAGLAKAKTRLEDTESTFLRIEATSEGWETWPPEKMISFVANEKQHDVIKKIKFNRIDIKINGSFLPCSDEKTTSENFHIFKAAIGSLKGPPLSDHQITEMIQLLDSDKLSQGFPSGADPSMGLVLGSAEAFPNESNIYEIKLAEDGSFDFHFDSGRSYLTSLQFPLAGRSTPLSSTLKGVATKIKNDFNPIDREGTDNQLLQFETKKKFTYNYAPSSAVGTQGALTITDSRQAYWPIRLLPSELKKAFDNIIKTPKSDTATTRHLWSSVDGVSEEGPAISDQFYHDLWSPYYTLEGEQFIDQKILSSQNFSEKEKEESLKKAAENFVAFVGDSHHAFAISQAVNQQLSFVPLLQIMNTATGPLQLPGHGGGLPQGKLKVFHSFTKSPRGQIVVAVKVEQNPSLFQPADSTKKSIPLKNSSLSFNYNITFNSDEAGQLSPEVGPILYDYHFEQGEE